MWIESLDETHDLTQFTSGNKAMDDRLQRHALENEQIGVSRTYLLLDSPGVIGYYTLAGMSAQSAELPKSLRSRAPQTVAHPGCLLARLAVATSHQGMGVARDLMVDAVRIACDAAERIGGRFLAVDPIDENARAMYRRWGFSDVVGDVLSRMYLNLTIARATFDAIDT